ncbi:MAG: hypothetical protein PWQ89_753 [Verrucomicrobiota bacterium]|jgi:sedoheptulokinase|nr:hypothetical protein [Verrucomicrobiota bacterium]
MRHEPDKTRGGCLQMNLIGLDIGTTTICGVLYSLEEGRSTAVKIRDNGFLDNCRSEDKCQDPEKILISVRAILDELIEVSSDTPIAGCSVSSQMHGILYVDEKGNARTPYYTWQNQRGLRLLHGKRIERIVSETIGIPVHTGYGIVTHYALAHNGEIPSEASKFCNIGDFIGMRLTGNTAPVTDITLAASLGIADVEAGKINRTLNRLDLFRDEQCPGLVSSSEVLGTYRQIPVVQAIGDNQASFIGSVQDRTGTVLLNYGTAGQLSFFNDGYRKFPNFETRPLGNEGYLYAAFSLSGGNSYRILARFFEQCAQLFSEGTPRPAIQVMDHLPLDFSTKEIACRPLFLGDRNHPESLASFDHITDVNFTPSNMIKALIQGMVAELYRYYETLPDEIIQGNKLLVGAGNGIRKNLHLMKAIEQEYNRPLVLLDSSEESCLGAVINAGKGVGIFSNYEEGSHIVVRYTQPKERAGE